MAFFFRLHSELQLAIFDLRDFPDRCGTALVCRHMPAIPALQMSAPRVVLLMRACEWLRDPRCRWHL